MRKTYVVWAHQVGKAYYGNDKGLVVGCYDNREAAQEHKRFIDGVENTWYAYVEFIELQSEFYPEKTTGLRSLSYEPFSS